MFYTCKSRFCTSCGQRATEAWQEDLEAILPDIPYIGITLTMPMEFRPIVSKTDTSFVESRPWERRPYNSGQRLDMACA